MATAPSSGGALLRCILCRSTRAIKTSWFHCQPGTPRIVEQLMGDALVAVDAGLFAGKRKRWCAIPGRAATVFRLNIHRLRARGSCGTQVNRWP